MEAQACAALLLASLLGALMLPAQGTDHQDGIDIYSLKLDSKVTSRFAHTVITSRVVNRANEAKEALFEVELPKTAFITNFSMIIDGVTYPGNIKEKAAAQEQYKTAISRGESAGLVKAVGRKVETFQVAVNVAPSAKVTFELVYEELLKRQLGKYELLLNIRPKQLVKHLQMDIHIFEPQGITFLETESTFMTSNLTDALSVIQNETKAHILFKPKEPSQGDTILDGNFIVRYDVRQDAIDSGIQIVNGYFVHYFAPTGLPTLPKSVVFVIDKSGSMDGRKIVQTREALLKVLGDLNPEDQFNLVVFNSMISQWQPSLLKATQENVGSAKKFVLDIRASGGTNINEAVLAAVHLLDESNQRELLPENSVSMIILLTDGEPTVGETNPENIQQNIQRSLDGKYALFCLGFGFDVSYSFLEKMALDNSGLARRIYEDSDAALQLQDFYQEVATPLLKHVEFKFPENTVLELSQNNFNLFFKGSELVVAGKLHSKEQEKFSVQIEGQSNAQNLMFKAEANVAEKEKVFQKQKYIFGNFMERLWAYLTIQQLLEKAVSATGEERTKLEARALALSLNFSFVTPLTSMVVTKPGTEDEVQVAEKPSESDNEQVDSRFHLGRGRGVSQRVNSRMFLQKSHFQTPSSNLLLTRGSSSRPQYHSAPPAWEPAGQDSSGLPTSAGISRLRNRGPEGPRRLARPAVPGSLMDVALESDHYFLRVFTTKAPTGVSVKNNTHFILPLPGHSDVLCLNVLSSSKAPLDLITDPIQGISVRGKFEKPSSQFVWLEVTYQEPSVRVHVTKDQIEVTRNGRTSPHMWKGRLFLSMSGLRITMEKGKRLMLAAPGKVTIGLVSQDDPQPALGLYLEDTSRFSDQVTGAIGQFYHDAHLETSGAKESNGERELSVQGQKFPVTSQTKKDFRGGETAISCWVLEKSF
ncbi:inter-alpha-trypsin inhibitor heavy chain H4 isoform X1 [Ornithorhynchus anatinus]|uniref:inter-alpha-trypsin inhibitor heavy chain H4 isoform X1 n=1 Tax=Ornithorhynchus anatinus TaxID=9258 RepID=UPI0010A7BFF0|nr:inter-alpha-trypsin inhibitor heavy chain H4 isoform X1 [Ornithorhynchus anatinus]